MIEETVNLSLTYPEAVVLSRAIEFLELCFTETLEHMDTDLAEEIGMLPLTSVSMKLAVGLFAETENRDEDF